jgi:glycerol-3-phosphate dehydrogenase (NAD(P)+)
MQVAVLGSGSWGTALALLLVRNGHRVTLCGRSHDEILTLHTARENVRYLPGFPIPEGVAFGLIDEAAAHADMTVVAVPSGAVREVLERCAGSLGEVVIAAKGLESGTGKRMTEVAAEYLAGRPLGVLGGPNLAVEIARGVPTVAVAAYEDQGAAESVRDAFSSPTFRISISNDVVGVELGGALKNVLAIGAGMSDGLGFGDNTKGAFLSRGLMEIARLGVALGARSETFLGPTGVGDLFATAASRLSRNYRLGFALGKGESRDEAVAGLGQVAEGVPTSEAVTRLARRYNVDLPVFAAVQAVLTGVIPPSRAVALLMERTVRMGDFILDGK